MSILHRKKVATMEITTTSNQFEQSTTVTRETGERVDFCYMPSLNEVIVGQTSDATGDNHTQIALNLEEAQILKEKLISVLG